MKKYQVLLLVLPIILLGVILSGCMSPSVSTYSVSGCVTYNGNGLSGVTMSFSDGLPSVVTNSQGEWSQSGLTGSVVVTPSLSGYTFTPSSLTVSGADNNVDFTAVPVVPKVTGSWNMTMTVGDQTLSGEALLLQSQDNANQVAMILPTDSQVSWDEGGLGFTGQINGDQISLMFTTSGQSISLNGTISNGLISGTVMYNGQSGTFTMSNLQPIVVTQQNIDLTGTWNFVLNDQTSGYTLNFTMDTYQDGSDLINVATSFSSSNGNSQQSFQGIALFGNLTGNSVTFNFNPGGGVALQLSGTLLTTSSMNGNFTGGTGGDTGTWSANLVSSTYQSKKPNS